MVNTPAHPGPFDPLVGADPDVPFFPLMGTDPLAASLVLEWADRARRHARGVDDDAARKRLFAKCNEAEEIAWAMQRYLKTGSPEDARARPVRATYSGAADDRSERERIVYATSSLREADYYACEARDMLRELGLLSDEDAAALQQAMDTLKRVAEAHEPKRALAA